MCCFLKQFSNVILFFNKNGNALFEEKNVDSPQKKLSRANLASKRPIQRAKETLDIEPLDETNLQSNNEDKSNKVEIDDPW